MDAFNLKLVYAQKLAGYANKDWDANMIAAEAHPQNTSCTRSGEVDPSASSTQNLLGGFLPLERS